MSDDEMLYSTEILLLKVDLVIQSTYLRDTNNVETYKRLCTSSLVSRRIRGHSVLLDIGALFAIVSLLLPNVFCDAVLVRVRWHRLR